MVFNFICPDLDRPVGGVKVLYKHCEFLVDHGIRSYIFHPKRRDIKGAFFKARRKLGLLSHHNFLGKGQNFSCSWFQHKAAVRRNTEKGFDRESDILVIPETYAALIGEQAVEFDFKYVIYVQNGYLIDSGVEEIGHKRLSVIYEKAKFVVSFCEDITAGIRLAYPNVNSDKILHVSPHLSPLFHPGQKEKLITYMPRKLADHSKKILFFLKNHLPEDWRIEPIDKLAEEQVAEILSRSSIFMSFCNQEGCALPPLEAAASGNLVVGYTGEGTKEYFRQPLFREVHNGDFHVFVREVLLAIEQVSSNLLFLTVSQTNEITALTRRYSNEREVRKLVSAFQEIMNS